MFSTFNATFVPDGQHKRSVQPGAHKVDLKPKTIQAAYDGWSARFSALGYRREER